MIREARGRRIIIIKKERSLSVSGEWYGALDVSMCALAAACLGGGPEKCPSALPFLIKTLTTTLYTIYRVQQGDDTGELGRRAARRVRYAV